MDFLEHFKFIWFLSLCLLSEQRNIHKRQVESEENTGDLRTPQKLIIEPLQTLATTSDHSVTPTYDAVDFDDYVQLYDIEAKTENWYADLNETVNSESTTTQQETYNSSDSEMKDVLDEAAETTTIIGDPSLQFDIATSDPPQDNSNQKEDAEINDSNNYGKEKLMTESSVFNATVTNPNIEEKNENIFVNEMETKFNEIEEKTDDNDDENVAEYSKKVTEMPQENSNYISIEQEVDNAESSLNNSNTGEDSHHITESITNKANNQNSLANSLLQTRQFNIPPSATSVEELSIDLAAQQNESSTEAFVENTTAATSKPSSSAPPIMEIEKPNTTTKRPSAVYGTRPSISPALFSNPWPWRQPPASHTILLNPSNNSISSNIQTQTSLTFGLFAIPLNFFPAMNTYFMPNRVMDIQTLFNSTFQPAATRHLPFRNRLIQRRKIANNQSNSTFIPREPLKHITRKFSEPNHNKTQPLNGPTNNQVLLLYFPLLQSNPAQTNQGRTAKEATGEQFYGKAEEQKLEDPENIRSQNDMNISEDDNIDNVSNGDERPPLLFELERFLKAIIYVLTPQQN